MHVLHGNTRRVARWFRKQLAIRDALTRHGRDPRRSIASFIPHGLRHRPSQRHHTAGGIFAHLKSQQVGTLASLWCAANSDAAEGIRAANPCSARTTPSKCSITSSGRRREPEKKSFNAYAPQMKANRHLARNAFSIPGGALLRPRLSGLAMVARVHLRDKRRRRRFAELRENRTDRQAQLFSRSAFGLFDENGRQLVLAIRQLHRQFVAHDIGRVTAPDRIECRRGQRVSARVAACIAGSPA